MESSPKSKLLAALNVILPDEELIVFPSIEILSTVKAPALRAEVPISIAPNPLEIAPEPRVPTVVN